MNKQHPISCSLFTDHDDVLYLIMSSSPSPSYSIGAGQVWLGAQFHKARLCFQSIQPWRCCEDLSRRGQDSSSPSTTIRWWECIGVVAVVVMVVPVCVWEENTCGPGWPGLNGGSPAVPTAQVGNASHCCRWSIVPGCSSSRSKYSRSRAVIL